MIYQVITFSDFVSSFHNMGRGDQFSYSGLGLIYDHLEEMGQDIELDIIAICCDFIEEDVEDYFANYISDDVEEDITDHEEKKRIVVEHIEENTFLIGVTDSGAVVYVNY